MGCKPIMEHYHRVVAALTLTLGVNEPVTITVALAVITKNRYSTHFLVSLTITLSLGAQCE